MFGRVDIMVKALILAGGFGKRLRPLTQERPKPLIEIKGKPILAWQFEWLRKSGIDEVILAVGYLKEKIIEEIGSGKRFGVKVGYVVEDEPLGTAGGLKNAEHVLKNEKHFFVLNGDIITNLDLKRLSDALTDDIVGAIAVVPLKSPYGIIRFNPETGKIMSFVEKPVLREYWINAGVYCLTPRIFEYLPEKGDIEQTAFPILAEKGLLRAVDYTDVLWKSIDTHKDVEEAEKLLSKYSIT